MPVVTIPASEDAYLDSFSPGTNYATATDLIAGEPTFRPVISFDLTAYAGATLNAAPTFRIRDNSGFDPSTLTIFLVTRAVVGGQVTWDVFSTGNSWATAGGSGTGDRSASNIGSASFSSGVGVRSISLDQTTVQSALGGVMWLMVQTNTYVEFDSVETANDPELEIDYTLAAADQPPQFDDDTLQAFQAHRFALQAAFLVAGQDSGPVGANAPADQPQFDDDTLQAFRTYLLGLQSSFLAATAGQNAVEDATGTAYTLTAETGAFTYSGDAANLLFNRLVAADTGTFSYAGNNANTLFNRLVAADTGVFTYAGDAANLLFSRRIAADTGAFSYAGNAANLLFNRRVAANTGAFSYFGNAADLRAARRLVADGGVFSYVGNDANLVYLPVGAYVLIADGGVFSYVGNDADLVYVSNAPAPVLGGWWPDAKKPVQRDEPDEGVRKDLEAVLAKFDPSTPLPEVQVAVESFVGRVPSRPTVDTSFLQDYINQSRLAISQVLIIAQVMGDQIALQRFKRQEEDALIVLLLS